MKALSDVAKDAMELRPKQRRTLARILLELSEEDNDFSPEWNPLGKRRFSAA
jgi:hypothetical protein